MTAACFRSCRLAHLTMVVQARKRLLGLSADDVLPSSAVNVADHLDGALHGLDERYQAILAKRLFAWNSKTLEELGQEFGVTRERVRQLEGKARAKLNDFVSGDTPVGRVASLVRTQIRGVRPLAELLAEVPALAVEVVTVGQPAWRIIDVLDDAYEIADGWCAEPSFEAARRDTAVFLDELADAYGVVRLADVTLSDDEAGSLPWLKDWLIYLGYEVRDQFVLLKTGVPQRHGCGDPLDRGRPADLRRTPPEGRSWRSRKPSKPGQH